MPLCRSGCGWVKERSARRLPAGYIWTAPRFYTANIGTATAGYVKVNVDVSPFADGVTVRTLKFSARFAGPALISIDDVSLDTGLPTPPACQDGALPWINLNPISGTVSAGSAAGVGVGFNSTGMASGTYTGNVCLRSNDAVNPFTLIPVSLTVVQYGVAIAPPTDAKSGNPGTNVIYTLHITNTGTTTDSFNVGVTGNVWTTNAPSNIGPLAAGASATTNISVTVPANAAGGAMDAASVTVTSQGDNSQTAASTLTTTANNVYGLSMTPATAAQNGNPGTNVVYTLHVTNTGNAVDTFNVAVAGNVWTTVAPASVSLASGVSASVNVTVTIPANATGGATDAATVTVTSQGDNTKTAASTLTTTANNVYGVNLVPATGAKSDYVGKTVGYTLTLINNSNVSDVFNISATGNAWSISAPITLTVNSGASQSFAVQVTISLTATHLATDTVTLKATAQSDVNTTSSSTLTTTAKKYQTYLPLVRK